MNIETKTLTKTLLDGEIAYTFSRNKIDYTVVPKANSEFVVWKTNNQRWTRTFSVDCYKIGSKKAPKFIIPILERLLD